MTYKEQQKIVNKKIKRRKYILIKPNQNFYNFYDELLNYFNSNLMPQCKISLNKNVGNPYYAFNTSVRRSDYAINISDQNTCKIVFRPHQGGIELQWFEMFQMGQGLGTQFMNAFTQISKKLNIKIYLIPGDLNDDHHVDKERRRNFYHRFNFRRSNDSRYWVN